MTEAVVVYQFFVYPRLICATLKGLFFFFIFEGDCF